MKTRRLTVAQALITFLQKQYTERDGIQHKLFAGCFGIFGHGNIAGIGQALFQDSNFKYYQCRNEQAMVHTAAAYAKMKNRLSTFACTSSIGPGATNMITAAAGATVNRIPVLLLPGDIFAKRNSDPVLQQLEVAHSQDFSVNDCFKPISKYWDRINRAEQLITSLPAAMRVLTSPAETGTVTLALPQDVQPEAFDFPEELFDERIWHVPRARPDNSALLKAVEIIRNAKKPMIISGGGTIYSEATDALQTFVNQTGIPVGETFAGKGALPYNDPHSLGGTGATGTEGANYISERADVIIGIGTRYSDFTTASKSAFQNENVKFININVTEFDAHKHSGLAVTGDARVVLEELTEALKGFHVDAEYEAKVKAFNTSWDKKVDYAYTPAEGGGLPSQSEVVGALNNFVEPKDVLLNASGSLPGDIHKLWRTRDPKGFHHEYGYSCMGYEIAGGLGAKMACPDREIYVMIGDGGYLMMSSEIVTSVQEGFKMIIILINNKGYGSIGGLSKSIGQEGFGTEYKFRNNNSDQLDGDDLPVDLAANAASLGAEVISATDIKSFTEALKVAKTNEKTTVIYIETVPERKIAGYGWAWWEVPIAEISKIDAVNKARETYVENKKKQRYFL